jgi:hypothetical protein
VPELTAQQQSWPLLPRATALFLLQALFCRRRHQPRRPPLANIRPGSPAPAMGPGLHFVQIAIRELLSSKNVHHDEHNSQTEKKRCDKPHELDGRCS